MTVTNLGTALDAPTRVHRWAARILRAAPSYLVPHDTDWAFNAAVLIDSDPDLVAMRAQLAALTARHRPVRWSPESAVVVCTCGAGDYDTCPDRLILNSRAPTPDQAPKRPTSTPTTKGHRHP